MTKWGQSEGVVIRPFLARAAYPANGPFKYRPTATWEFSLFQIAKNVASDSSTTFFSHFPGATRVLGKKDNGVFTVRIRGRLESGIPVNADLDTVYQKPHCWYLVG